MFIGDTAISDRWRFDHRPLNRRGSVSCHWQGVLGLNILATIDTPASQAIEKRPRLNKTTSLRLMRTPRATGYVRQNPNRRRTSPERAGEFAQFLLQASCAISVRHNWNSLANELAGVVTGPRHRSATDRSRV